jgi:hypothetical protein
MFIAAIGIAAVVLAALGLASLVAWRAEKRGRTPLPWAALSVGCSAAAGVATLSATLRVESMDHQMIMAVLTLLAPVLAPLGVLWALGKMSIPAGGSRVSGSLLAEGRAISAELAHREGVFVCSDLRGDELLSIPSVEVVADGELIYVGPRFEPLLRFRPAGKSRAVRVKRAATFATAALGANIEQTHEAAPRHG